MNFKDPPMTTPRLLSDRAPYLAMPDRPPLKMPDGKRMVVWIIVNVEHWSIERAMPRTVLPPPMGQPLLPDLPNWSWHEYGMRAGFWRLYDALVSRHIVPTLAINGIVCQSYPRVAQAALDAAIAAADPADRIVVFGSFFTVGGILANGIPRLDAPHLSS